MDRRDYIIATLTKEGFRTSLKGFWQFLECLELYLDDFSTVIDSIYARVASDFDCTKSSVEKNLRRLFDASDACGIIGRLFGMSYHDVGNKELISLYANYFRLYRYNYGSEMRQNKTALLSAV